MSAPSSMPGIKLSPGAAVADAPPVLSQAWRTFPEDAHLPQGNDKVACILFFAGKTYVVVGDEHLARNVQLAEWCPQCAARVAVQPLIPGQPEGGPIALVLSSGIQVSEETRWVQSRQGSYVQEDLRPQSPHHSQNPWGSPGAGGAQGAYSSIKDAN